MIEHQELLEKLEREIEQTKEDINKEEALDRLREMWGKYSGDDEVVDLNHVSELMENEPEEPKMMTGLPGLDNILDGFRPGQVVTLAGITKHGKTAFAMELINRLAEYNPCLFPFEEPARELVRKFKERGDVLPTAYVPKNNTSNTLTWIEERTMEAIAKYDCKIVFIDHLGYIGGVKSENRSYDIEDTMKKLKKMANRWGITIFLLAHLSKAKLDRNPDLEDLKGSSAIAQESDTVMLIWRDTKREGKELVITNEATLSIQANRRTGYTGNLHFTFTGNRYIESEQHAADIRAENEYDSL